MVCATNGRGVGGLGCRGRWRTDAQTTSQNMGPPLEVRAWWCGLRCLCARARGRSNGGVGLLQGSGSGVCRASCFLGLVLPVLWKGVHNGRARRHSHLPCTLGGRVRYLCTVQPLPVAHPTAISFRSP